MTKAELREKIRALALQVVGEKSKADDAALAYDELTKFPELKDVIVSLLTHEFDSFLEDIMWVSPRPSSFRIVLLNGQSFLLTYGDGLSDVNINKTIENHNKKGKICSITTVYPPGRFGAVEINKKGLVSEFIEKPAGDGGMINGGYFVANKEIFNYIEGDQTVLESEPLNDLASDAELAAYKHMGFWQPMDTMRDKNLLDSLWNSGEAPWKVNK